MSSAQEPAAKRQRRGEGRAVTVLGAGFSGLTTAAELAMRGFKVRVVAKDYGFRPPVTICGTQSRRHPGMAVCNKDFNNDDLLEKELATINRLVAVHGGASGVSVLPALKVSRKEGVWWNMRPLNAKAKEQSTRVQECLQWASTPSTVDPAVKERLRQAGYKSIDETQVVQIDTQRYFDYLVERIAEKGGRICLGCAVTAADVEAMAGPVVNCLGLEAPHVGGAEGKYYSNPGEEVVFSCSPGPMPFYIIDDDTNGALMLATNGSLVVSSAAKPKHGSYDEGCSKQTVADVDTLAQALFGANLNADDIAQSWATDRPSREDGFNLAVKRRAAGILVNNSGHGGAGVTASWACASLAAEALVAALE